MPAPKKVSDDQIIPLIRQGLSPAQILRKVGLTPGNNNQGRIRRLCEKIGINYNDIRTSNITSVEERERLKVIVGDRERVYKLRIRNGTILVGTDPHYSLIDRISVAHTAFCKIARQIKPKAVIINGDIGDFGAVSRFPRGPWRNVKRPDIKQEIEAIQARTEEIELAAGPCTFLRTLGNHDDRFEARLAAVAPEYEGIAGTRLKDHIPKWHECERIDVNNDLEFIHNSKSGEIGRDRQNVFATGHHTIVGHSHQLHVWPQTWRRGTYYGVCAGTLADLDDDVFHYLGSRPANWQSGFVVLTFRDGNLICPEKCTIEHGKAWFRGEEV